MLFYRVLVGRQTGGGLKPGGAVGPAGRQARLDWPCEIYEWNL